MGCLVDCGVYCGFCVLRGWYNIVLWAICGFELGFAFVIWVGWVLRVVAVGFWFPGFRVLGVFRRVLVGVDWFCEWCFDGSLQLYLGYLACLEFGLFRLIVGITADFVLLWGFII